ncbi:MAG: hypothetical protein IJI14_00845 [Anaerolineaceae bacterium]|nr:hypothetical protein [Anaerolineaceae bacterium]
MDVFFENGRDPWSMKKTELSFISDIMKNFECRNGVTTDGDYRLSCTSKKGAYEGGYRFLFTFGDKNDLYLDAVEITAYHPRLKKSLDNYGTIKIQIDNFKNTLRMKPYTENYKTQYEIEKYIHTMMAENVIYDDSFTIPGGGITLGHIEDKIILNIASPEYYNKNHYYTKIDEKTGQVIRVQYKEK